MSPYFGSPLTVLQPQDKHEVAKAQRHEERMSSAHFVLSADASRRSFTPRRQDAKTPRKAGSETCGFLPFLASLRLGVKFLARDACPLPVNANILLKSVNATKGGRYFRTAPPLVVAGQARCGGVGDRSVLLGGGKWACRWGQVNWSAGAAGA